MKNAPRYLPPRHPLLGAMLLALFPLLAQAAPPGTPSAGTILQQIQPPAPPPLPAGTPSLKIEGNTGMVDSSTASTPFMVNHTGIAFNFQ